MDRLFWGSTAPKGFDHGGAALEGGREGDLEGAVEGVRVGDLLVVPDAPALAPPVGLVVAEEQRERAAEEQRPVCVPAEVVGRAQDHLPVALLEPAAVEADDREILGELGGVDESDAPGSTAGAAQSVDEVRGQGLDHLAEAVAQLAVGVDGAGGGSCAPRALRITASASPVGVSLLISHTERPPSVTKRVGAGRSRARAARTRATSPFARASGRRTRRAPPAARPPGCRARRTRRPRPRAAR